MSKLKSKAEILLVGEEEPTATTDTDVDKDWEEFKGGWMEVITILGGFVFLPLIVFMAIMYGFRAGVVEGTSKLLVLLTKNWYRGVK